MDVPLVDAKIRASETDLPVRNSNAHLGPFKYYVSKKVGGWGMPNAYIFLHGGWVGLARCLHNQKKKKN